MKMEKNTEQRKSCGQVPNSVFMQRGCPCSPVTHWDFAACLLQSASLLLNEAYPDSRILMFPRLKFTVVLCVTFLALMFGHPVG